MSELKNNSGSKPPIIPADVSLPEITFRALVLGFILTVVLAAANAYLGLKVGTTVSASIPAAVISMGILRFFKNSNILENTMVQIMASVGEALTAGIAFILPALLILHVWDKFNYWQTVITGLLGGGLGVLFTIPLRRALLQDKTLRYPEAVAIGNVLKASASREEGDLKSLVVGGVVGSLIALFQAGFQILRDSFQFWFRANGAIYGFGLGLSPALIAAGYIVGVNVALSLLVGIFIGWVCGVPVLSWYYGIPDVSSTSKAAAIIWSQHIRYIGVGTMLVGGLWTLCTLFKPVVHSMSASFNTIRKIRLGEKAESLRTERDIPIHYVFIFTALLLIPIFFLIACAIIPENIGVSPGFRYFISGFSTIYILVGGFVFCSVMAYFAGLIGSTNSPVSGLLVSALLVLCLILMVFFNIHGGFSETAKEMVGSVVAIGSMVVIGAALSISNDTMQDLKVGQIVGATPWKQQMMLILGVVTASFVIPPILQLLYNAYGIGGVFPREGMNPAQMLAAPQAGLMATVAKGAFSHQLQWGLIGFGALVAVLSIIVDEFLKKNYGTRLPVLAVGVGIYLPLDSSMPVVIGGLLSYIIQQRLLKKYHRGEAGADETQISAHRHTGLLLACGIVAGASIMGVLLAIPFAWYESADALKIMPDSLMPFAGPLSVAVTFLLCFWIYKVVLKSKS